MPESHRISERLAPSFNPSWRDLWRWQTASEFTHAGRALALLKRIESDAARGHCASRTWLLKYRSDLKWASDYALVSPIKLYLYRCPAEMIPIAIWMWGRCTDRFRLYGLSAFCHHSSPQVRRHVAKILRRVEAWALLNEMAEAYPDDAKIQWYANSPTSGRSFTKRLKNFTAGVDKSHADEVVTPSQMPYWSRDSFWSRTPPKSVEMIRRMLRRIQHLVRWGTA